MTPKGTIDLPLGGVDTLTDPLLVQPGKTLRLLNADFSRVGGLVKRPGVGSPLASHGGITPIGLYQLNGELLLADGKNLYALHGSTWRIKSPFYPVRTRETQIGDAAVSSASAKYKVIGVDMARGTTFDSGASTLVATAVEKNSSDIVGLVSLVDTSTGSTKYTWRGGQKAVRCAVTSANGFVFYEKPVTGTDTLHCRVINASTLVGTESALTLWTPDADTTWDACVIPGSSSAIIAAVIGGVVRVGLVSSAGSITLVGNGGDTGLGATDVGVCPYYDTSAGSYYVMVCFRNTSSNDVRAFSINAAGTKSFETKTVVSDVATACRFSGVDEGTSTVRWLYGRTVSGAATTSSFGVTSAGSVSSSTNVSYLQQASRPFRMAGATFAWLQYPSDYQPAAFLVNMTNGMVVARALSGLLSQATYRTNVETSGNVTGVTGSPTGSADTVALATYAQNLSGGSAPVLLRTKFYAPPVACEHDGRLMLGSGLLYEYDGSGLLENSQLLAPSLSASATSSGSLSDGVYQVVAVVELVDRQNKVHRSPVSAPVTVTISGASKTITAVAAAVGPSLWSWYRSDLAEGAYASTTRRVRIFMTAANGSVFYSVGDCPSGTLAITTNPDTSAEEVYTQDGTIETAHPDQLVGLASKGKRLYGITADGTLWHTHETVLGEAPSFAPLFYTELPVDGHEYALAAMDDLLVVLSEHKVRVLSGGGYNATGTYNDLSDPRDIPVSAGILPLDGRVTPAYPPPALATAQGVIFQSAEGVRMLDRALQVQLMGDAVTGQLTDGNGAIIPVVGMAKLSYPSHSKVLLFPTSGGTLSYDLRTGQWSVFTSHTLDAVRAVVTTPAGNYSLANGFVCTGPNVSGYTDQSDTTGVTYSLDVTFPWVRFGSLQGRQRVWRLLILGTWRSPHVLTLELTYDYATTVSETITVDLRTGLTAGQPIMLRRLIGKRCEAVKVRIYETPTAPGGGSVGTAESLTLSAVSLEGVTKPGAAKRSTTRTI